MYVCVHVHVLYVCHVHSAQVLVVCEFMYVWLTVYVVRVSLLRTIRSNSIPPDFGRWWDEAKDFTRTIRTTLSPPRKCVLVPRTTTYNVQHNFFLFFYIIILHVCSTGYMYGCTGTSNLLVLYMYDATYAHVIHTTYCVRYMYVHTSTCAQFKINF